VRRDPPDLRSLRGQAGLLQWTRTQRIRTAATIEVQAVIVEAEHLPVYLQIAEKAKHLRELGMSDKAIARQLRVSDKTVAKSVSRT
jgi:hypothetical protein